MTHHYVLTEEDMRVASIVSWRRWGYPPVRETVSIPLDTHPSYRQQDGGLLPFVRLEAVPERFQKPMYELAIGSACPSIDGLRNTFYPHDVDRWLRAIGVQAEFIEP